MKNNEFVYIFGGAIGDALLGVHLGCVLAASVPGASLTLVATRKNDFVRNLLQPIPFVHFIEMPKGNLLSLFTLFKLGFSAHYTAMYEPISAFVPLWWRIILGFATFQRGSVDVRCTLDCRTGRVFDLIPKILEKWGIQPQLLTPHIDRTLYRDQPPAIPNPYLVFHFFAPFTIRSEPTSKARELLAEVQKEFTHHQRVLTCAPHERARAERMADALDVRVLCGLSPAAIISLIAGADAYVGVDTGITHIACHLGVPCVVLGNRSNPCWLPSYAPQATILFEEKRCGCNGDKTGDCREETSDGPVYRCLFDISTESVISAMKKYEF